jgi:hypothetical protein
MFQDYKDLLFAFHAHGVKYLIVGGYAVSFHAQPRATKDIDIFIAADPANARAVYAALTDFGAPLQNISVEDLSDRNGFIRFGQEPLGFDVLPAIPGVDFDSAWGRRVEAVIDPGAGLKAYFISRDDLISSKLATARPQDLADVNAIRNASESRGEETRKKK